MAYDQEVFKAKLRRWKTYMENYHLPTWDQLPTIELYMDQVVLLVSQYLDLIPHSEEAPVVTPSTINNYVRLKAVPPPQKKRYSRRHLAYVIMICALKQSMTLTEIQKLLPPDLSDGEMQGVYDRFVASVRTTSQIFITHIDAMATQELVPGNEYGCTGLVLHSAVSSMLYKLLTVKLTNLDGAEPQKD